MVLPTILIISFFFLNYLIEIWINFLKMKRGKNGRFIRNPNIEINLQTPHGLIKYSILMFILLPWIYLSNFKFNIVSVFENVFNSLLGPNEWP